MQSWVITLSVFATTNNTCHIQSFDPLRKIFSLAALTFGLLQWPSSVIVAGFLKATGKVLKLQFFLDGKKLFVAPLILSLTGTFLKNGE